MPPPTIPTIPTWATTLEYGIDLQWRTYGTPSLSANGVLDVDAFTASEVRHGPVPGGFWSVYLNGVDYTFWRNQISRPIETSDEDPGDDSDATVLFPVTNRESFGSLPSDFGLRASMDLWLADPSVPTQYRMFRGHVRGWGYRDGFLVAKCRGAWRQLDDYVRMPAVTEEPDDIGHLVASQTSHTSRLHLTNRLGEMTVVTIGIPTRYRGSGEKVTDAVAKWLTLAVDPTTGATYTVTVDDDRTPALVQRVDPSTVVTPDFWVTLGTPGVVVDVEQDAEPSWTVAYARGVGPGGEPWFNAYPLTPDGVLWQPDEYDAAVHSLDENATGGLDNHPERLSAGDWRNEVFFDFGSGVDQAQARQILHRLRLMLVDPGWFGTVSLTGVDFEGGIHRYRARNNKTVGIRGLHGGDKIFRIAQVVRDHVGKSVRMVVDTKMRDIHWLESMANREDVKAKNPIARLNVGTDAGLRPAAKVPWITGKSGWIPNDDTNGHRYAPGSTATFPITGKSWAVAKFLAAEAENFYRFEFHVSPAAPFHVSLYCMDPTDISHDKPVTDIVDPMAPTAGTPPIGPWTDPKPDGFINGWGQRTALGLQRAGFYPLKELTDDGVATGAPATGDFVVKGDFSFTHDDAAAAQDAGTGVNEPAYLWVAVWVDAVGSFSGWGRMVRGQVVG